MEFERGQIYRIGVLHPKAPVDDPQPGFIKGKELSVSGERLIDDYGVPTSEDFFRQNPINLPFGNTWTIYKIDHRGHLKYQTEGLIANASTSGLSDDIAPTFAAPPPQSTRATSKMVEDLLHQVHRQSAAAQGELQALVDNLMSRNEQLVETIRQMTNDLAREQRERVEERMKFENQLLLKDIEERFNGKLVDMEKQHEKYKQKQAAEPGLADGMFSDMLEMGVPLLVQYLQTKMSGAGGTAPAPIQRPTPFSDEDDGDLPGVRHVRPMGEENEIPRKTQSHEVGYEVGR